jgi:predicted ribonuclease toxin of YeeF-YezG toxin-antitoxin module
MDQRFNQLITTLDKFLKRLADLEDEFELMKADLKRVKTILREKLGVALD